MKSGKSFGVTLVQFLPPSRVRWIKPVVGADPDDAFSTVDSSMVKIVS
jgi:hypothetical protein